MNYNGNNYMIMQQRAIWKDICGIFRDKRPKDDVDKNNFGQPVPKNPDYVPPRIMVHIY